MLNIKAVLIIVVLVGMVAAIGMLLGKEGVTSATVVQPSCTLDNDCGVAGNATCENPGTLEARCIPNLPAN